MHSNTNHTCQKLCHKNTIGEKTNDYDDICLTSENPDKNVYSYCQNTFVEKPLVDTCKHDMCNLCCVNINTLKKRKHAYGTMKSCFSSCSKSKLNF